MKKQGKILRKLIRSYIMIAIIPLILIAIVTFKYTQAKLTKQMQNSVQSTIRQANFNISTIINEVDALSDYYFTSNILKDAIREDDIIEGYKKFQSIYDKLGAGYYKYANNITVISEEGNNFIGWQSNGKDYYQLREKLLETSWYDEILEAKGKNIWIPTHSSFDSMAKPEDREVITSARILRDLYIPTKTLGVLLIDLPTIHIKEIIDSMFNEYNASNVIINRQGESVCTQNNPHHFSSDMLTEMWNKEYGSAIRQIDGEETIIVFDYIEQTDWMIMSLIPTKNLYREIRLLKDLTFGLVLIVIIFVTIISYKVSKGISKPIKQLQDGMLKVEEGDLNTYVTIESHDEIEILAKNFNRMVKRVKGLMEKNKAYLEQKKRLEVAKKEAEIRMLTAQINPHFLFNTLNSIKCLALLNDDHYVADMIASLGALLESTITKKSDYVLVEEEVKDIQRYVKLQKMRFGNKINFCSNVQASVNKKMMPKFLLQPIVENAMIHGLEGKKTDGLIFLEAKQVENLLVFTIRDNGIGFDTSKNIENKNRKLSGIGLSNIDERLRLIYGESYGLKVISELGKGTAITINIPLDIEPEKLGGNLDD